MVCEVVCGEDEACGVSCEMAKVVEPAYRPGHCANEPVVSHGGQNTVIELIIDYLEGLLWG